MTSPHQDAADLVAELRSPTTYACVQPTHLHRLDYDKGRQLLNRAANLIEQQAKALSEAEAERDALARDCQRVNGQLADTIRAVIYRAMIDAAPGNK